MIEWRDVIGYEGLYQVSEFGDIMNLNYKNSGKAQIMKQHQNKDGYMQIKLTKNGTRKNYKIHRLVAEVFCNKECEEYNQVNHIDEDKTNNRYSNLEWCDAKYNSNYGTRNERKGKKMSLIQMKKVRCVELDIVFDSIMEASEITGANRPHISDCLTGKRKTCGGYHWELV